MAPISFDSITFRQVDEGLRIFLLDLFTAIIPKEEVDTIGEWEVADKDSISFDINEELAEKKFGLVLSKHMLDLKNKMTGNPVTYVTRGSGIPLIGNVAFGIVYRGSSIIEIKPVTSCNLDCVYCSISEGLSSKKRDFIVDKDYLLEELDKLIDFVGEEVEVHIGVQGEPFLYSPMESLISDLQSKENVSVVSIDTNGTFLNRAKIDRLAKNTKLQLNLSLDAIDPDVAKKVAGTKGYNIEHVKDVIAYASEKINVIVAPVLTKKYNLDEMEKIILFIKSLKKQPKLGIQNFLRYKTGRNPGKEIPWDEFYAMIEDLEKKHDIKLRWSKEDFNIHKTKTLPKPFFKGETVDAVIKCPDRFPNSCIAVSGDRNISVVGCKFRENERIKVKITRDKHNVFVGKKI